MCLGRSCSGTRYRACQKADGGGIGTRKWRGEQRPDEVGNADARRADRGTPAPARAVAGWTGRVARRQQRHVQPLGARPSPVGAGHPRAAPPCGAPTSAARASSERWTPCSSRTTLRRQLRYGRSNPTASLNCCRGSGRCCSTWRWGGYALDCDRTRDQRALSRASPDRDLRRAWGGLAFGDRRGSA